MKKNHFYQSRFMIIYFGILFALLSVSSFRGYRMLDVVNEQSDKLDPNETAYGIQHK